MLRTLGADFQSLECDTAASINSPLFLAQSNLHLDLSPIAGDDTAEWLNGEQIIELATALNPDRAGTSPSWLYSPSPLNFWRTRFVETVTDERQHGRVHLMVVNSEAQYTLTDEVGGRHWFAVAWWINPAPAPARGA